MIRIFILIKNLNLLNGKLPTRGDESTKLKRMSHQPNSGKLLSKCIFDLLWSLLMMA